MSELLHIPIEVRQIAEMAARRYVGFDGSLIDLIAETLAQDRAARFAPKKRVGLTVAQTEVFYFVKDYIGQHGFPPNYREIAKAVGLKSTSGVHRMIKGLEERGAIRRLPSRARTLEIVGGAR